jgi:hypothetical protein
MDTTTPATTPTISALSETTSLDAHQVDDVDSEFFALIYADPELLRDEFEQLVAAAWSGRPPRTEGPDRGFVPPADGCTPPSASAGRGRPAERVGRARDRGARTRSPPSTTSR